MLLFRAIQAVAQRLAVRASLAEVRAGTEIESILDALAREAGPGLIVPADTVTAAHRRPIIDAAARHRIPTIYGLNYMLPRVA